VGEVGVAGITVEIEGIEKISDIKKKKLGRETDFLSTLHLIFFMLRP
jgi:hypothetical protein